MRGSKAAAEAAALEGLLSSPDTQECRRIFQACIGCDFESPLTIDDCTPLNQPQLSPPFRNAQPLSHLHHLVSRIETVSCFKQGDSLTTAEAALHPLAKALHLTDISGRDTCHARPDLLDRQEEPRTEQINVHPVPPSALYGSTEKIFPSRAHGIAVTSCSRAGKMEDFISPLDRSDSGNLSPTQENDPAVYIRLQQELLALPTNSQSSSQARVGALQDLTLNTGSAPSAQDTGITYAVNDTGHLTLDYQPPLSNPTHDSFDEDEVGEVSSGRLKPHLFDGGLLHPQTPAQAKLVIGHPGTVMRPSQMFAETQPSPGSREGHLLPPSSSRPSPDLFNQYQWPKHLASSPLARRVSKIQSEGAADFNVSSSPGSLRPDGDGSQKIDIRRPLSKRADLLTNAKGGSPIPANFMHQYFPEPFDIYTTRKESQERRREQAMKLNDAEESSDDGFSDDEAELNRRARRRKQEAARELAVIGTSRPGSAGKDFVEVPSTNTGRRRSLAEEYEAQCSGFDARDSQPDATILDSQSELADMTIPSADITSARNDGEICQADPQSFHHQDCSQEDLAHSGNAVDDENSLQLPALERNEDSDATESGRGGSESPVAQQIVSQVPANIAELRTPAMHKKLPYVDGDTIVPETSPSEPHLQRYGEIVSQTPPVLSAEEVDDAFNPFTQDTEFNNLIQSPSPRRTRSSRTTQPPMVTTGSNVEPDLGAIQRGKEIEKSNTDVDHSTTRQHEDWTATSLVTKETASEDASEYVTAPTGLTFESLSTPRAQSSLRMGRTNTSFTAPNNKVLSTRVSPNSQLNPADENLVSGAVIVSEMKQPLFSTDNTEASSLLVTTLPQKLPNGPQPDEDNMVVAASDVVLEMRLSQSPPAKRVRISSRSSQKSAKQSKSSLRNNVVAPPVSMAAGPSEVLPNRLRPATQLRGSSRALRRLLEDSSAACNTPVPAHVTPTPTVQNVTRSSRRSSTNPSDRAQSTELDADITPTLSTRRRTLSNQPVEPGLFDSMAFSVTYSTSREDEKQQVLGLIRKNGGRLLEKGFDELFDMNSLQSSSVTRSTDGDSQSNGSNLILTAAARGVGFACVIADDHSRRVKFMQALALGLPCISGRWIEHCVAKKEVVNWDQYHLAAGESAFLGGAIRSRNLQLYPANSASFANRFEMRPKLLTGKSILLVTGRGRVEERRKPYFFLTQALGARRVKHVPNNQEARKFLLEAETNGDEWNWVYVDENEGEAEKAIFGAGTGPPKKRKRGSEIPDDSEITAPPPKKVRIVSDEYVIQSLILGKFLEE